MKRRIWLRDEGCCTHVNPETGKRCASTHQLEIDHIHPHALGGETTEENLRLLCRAHNQWRAKQTFQR